MKDYSEDKKLAERCCSGDESAWGEFSRKYDDLINRFAANYSFISGEEKFSDQLRVEICSLVKEKLCENDFARFKTYQGKSKLSTWLTTFIINHAINFMEKINRERKTFERLAPQPGKNDDLDENEERRELIDTFKNSDIDFFEHFEGVEKSSKLNNALATLTPYEKRIFLLKHRDKLSQQQISRYFKKNQGTIGSDLSRIKQKLKNAMLQ